MRVIKMILILTVFMITSLAAEEARLLRFPDVNGDRVAFVYAGDIYTAPRTGGQALRLTSHEGLELFPKFSPDGSQLAFTGQYDGDMAVYVMPVSGGSPKKLTFHPGIQHTSERFGPENVVMGWHPDGQRVLFRSRKERSDWWDGRAYLVNINGGMPEPLPMYVAGFTSLSPDADKVAYCPIYRDFRTWKRYKGGMAQDVWIYDMKNNTSQKITDWIGTDNMPMWYRDKIYFNSDRTETGRLNLFCYDINTGQTEQVTDFTEYDVRWPSLGPDGIAFENGGYVYVLDLPSQKLNKVTIQLTYDHPSMRSEFVDVSDKVNDFDLSPDANRVVFRARGELFTVPAKDGNTRNLTNSSGADDASPTWSPDGRWIAYISDESGEEELYLVSHDGKEKVRLTFDGYCHRYGPEWSPDSKKLIYSDKELNLYYIDIDEKKPVKIDESKRNEFRTFSWSPDSRFVAYNKDLENEITAIFLYDFSSKKIHQVTPGLTNDYNPAFDPEGKYLYFLSQRNFNPVLSNYEFEYVNQNITDLFLIVLAADEKSPFAPKSDEVKLEDDAAKTDKKKDKDEDKDKNKTDAEKVTPVKIDFDGIFDRQVAFDLPAGNYRGLRAVKGAVFYTSNPIWGLKGKLTQDKTDLHKYDIEKEKDHVFADGTGWYKVSSDMKKMLIGKDGGYYIVDVAGNKASFEDNRMDLSQMKMQVDRKAEYAQMFDETWRMLRDFFYDPDMHGVDWKAEHDLYAALLPYVSNRYDLTYILGEMVGELCCSHTYVGGGDKPRIPTSKIGLLGCDFAIDKKADRIKISRVLLGENWDPDLRSPLTEPGIEVKAGDYLLAIDGHELTGDINPYSLTENCEDRTLTLLVNDKPDMKTAHEVTVKPIMSEETLRYYNWVENNQRHVDSASNGQIGYIHIPDMDSFGLVRFARMFYHQLKKPGLIIDVRYNGGGFVSGLILERLRRIVVAMGASRTFAVGRAPGSGINAYMLTLTNQFSCSDGDYFPYFFRQYQLGPLMGKRTWGGVIGIRGYRPLIDGGYYTAPEFGIYNLEGKWIMENIGVVPDIEVDNLPERSTAGFDDQLDQAIDNIMTKLKANPKTLPPRPAPPAPR